MKNNRNKNCTGREIFRLFLVLAAIGVFSFVSMPRYCLAEKAPLRTETTVDSVVASVNGKPITFFEISSRLGKARTVGLKQASSDAEFRQLLDTAIMEQVILDEAQNRKIGVSDDEIENFFSEVAKRNSLSKEGFLEALQHEGTNLDTYKRQVRVEILRSKLGGAILQGGIAVSQSELAEYLSHDPLTQSSTNKIRLRQIFVDKAGKGGDAAKQKIEEVYTLLKDGEEFAELAKKYSEAPEAAEGGLLGEVSESELNPSIFQAVSVLSQDQYSAVTESESGYQIFYVEQRLKSEPDTDQQKERELEARRVLENQKLQERMQNYFTVEILKNHSVDKKI